MYSSLKEYTTDRQTQYEVLRQSQQIKERAPLTIVSMTFKIAIACQSLAQERGLDWNSKSTTLHQKEKILTEVFNEFNEDGLNAVTDSYKLNDHQRHSVQNLLLHTAPQAVKLMQELFDHVPEKKNLSSIWFWRAPGGFLEDALRSAWGQHETFGRTSCTWTLTSRRYS